MDNSVAERVSANRRLFAVGLMSDVERLNSLDDAWTLFLSDPDNESELQDNLPGLQSMVGEMVGLLSAVAVKSQELEQMTVELDTDFDRELDLLLGEHPGRDYLAGIRPPSPFAAVVQEACQLVRKEAPREMAELTQKLVRIAEGKFEPGDLKRWVKRALLIVGAAAGLLVAISVPGAIVIPVGLTVGAGVVTVVAGFIVAWDSLPADAAPAAAS
jgi:hypothetical protein